MKNISLSNSYHLKWRFKESPHICISDNKKRTVINTKTGRILKPTICSYSSGYWIDKKFITLSKINNAIELISNDECCPF